MMPSQSTTAATPPWPDLLPELLGRIVACCPNSGDRARFRSVCRSWHSAVRHHCPGAPPPPWIVLHNGSFLTLSDDHRRLPSAVVPSGEFLKPHDRGPHSLALPGRSNICVGCTDGWLALCHEAHDDNTIHGYSSFRLHNPFSNTTVPLPGVDAIARAPPSRFFQVVKVLMRSGGADDVVAVMTVSRRWPFVLSLPGRGATWTPDPGAQPFGHIGDVAFMGDKLYGITKYEDLFCFHLSLTRDDDDEVVPAVTRCERIIRHPLDDNSYYIPWSDVEDDDDDENNDDDVEDDDDDNDDDVEDDDDDENNDEQDIDDELLFPPLSGEDEDNNSEEEEEEEEEEEVDDNDDDPYEHGAEKELVPSSIDSWIDEANKDCIITTTRYLVESCGKLIMVRRKMVLPDARPRYTSKVEVFEADTEAGAWVPVPNELSNGRSIFVSNPFSKCVSTSEYGEEVELDDDSIYFADTGEVFNMRSKTISPARWCSYLWSTAWLFPPGFVA